MWGSHRARGGPRDNEVGKMVGRWGVVNRVRRRDRLRSRSERTPHTARTSGRLVLAGGNPSGMGATWGSFRWTQ